MLKMIKKIVIIGGGTAGWLTALWIRKIFPNYLVTLVESKEIGIIGVGEATTPNLIDMLYELDIDPIKIVKETKGSIKNGISFENWHGDNTKYFHDFNPLNKLSSFKLKNIFSHDCYDYFLKNLINKNFDFNKHTYIPKISYQNKIDLNNTNFALHFDATLMAENLKKIALKRNIKHLYDNFKKVNVCEKNFIKSLVFEKNKKIMCDFVFDCSGFSKIILGNYYKSKWNSYSKYLAMKKAILCPYEYDDKNIWPYTKAIAMKNGWVFEIPLQHRVGRGYIFDSNYINEEEALKELEKKYNKKIEIKKTITFESGSYEEFWVKNAMCIGLSSSFLEPLESTSLFISVGQLNTLRFFLNNLFTCEQNKINLFNEIMRKNMEGVLEFVRLHYVTKRKDSQFWIDYNKNYQIPDSLNHHLSLINKGELSEFDINNIKKTTYFTLSSYLQVCNGLKLFNKINVKNYDKLDPNLSEYNNIINTFSKNSIGLYDFIKSTKQ